MSRLVMDSNNLWLVGDSEGTIMVLEGPSEPNLNTSDVPSDLSNWKQVARIGSTHQELEVFGVVFGSGQKELEELRKKIYDNQLTINREGFMVHRNVKEGNLGLYRRLNDLFDWSTHGVEIPNPIQTAWDRYDVGTGDLIVDGSGSAHLTEAINQMEIENEMLRDEKDMEIQELMKQKDDQLAAKDKQIDTLRSALKLFI